MRVCVVGAGFAGLVAAPSLAERGVEPGAGPMEGALRSGLRAADEILASYG